MILSIGEILVDVFNDGKTETVFPGGAPFNVAANIASFGGDVLFCGAIGKDEYGSFLKQYISNISLNSCNCQLENVGLWRSKMWVFNGFPHLLPRRKEVFL